MSKFDTIKNKGTYTELANYCDENNLILKEDVEDDKYICSITDKDQSHTNILNCLISDSDEVQILVMSTDGTVVDNLVNGKIDNIFDSIISGIDAMNLLNKSLSKNDNILNEDEDNDTIADSNQGSNLVSSLNKYKLQIKDIADSIKDSADLTEDPEMVSIIVDIASSAYALILDIESAIETYNQMMGIEDDDITEESVDLIDETKSRVKVLESVSAMINLCNLGKVSREDYEAYSDLCTKIFS